jgi:multisubunit Na+/H+ antiporter MnhC subunit
MKNISAPQIQTRTTDSVPELYILTAFIISMAKLLEADWLRGVQLFH